MREPTDEQEVLATGEVFVDRGVLPRQTDAAAHAVGIFGDVDPGHERLTGIGLQDGGEDAHHRRLARTIGAEQTQHRAVGNTDVDTVESTHTFELFDEPGGSDCVCHGSSICRIHLLESSV